MNQKIILYVQMVAQYGSITRAAEKLYITPSALSKYIGKLEQELGIALFDRLGNHFALTYAGERYLEWLLKIQDLSRQMTSEMNDLATQRSGKLRIGTQMSVSDVLVDRIIPQFMHLYPDVCVSISEDISYNILKQLEQHKIDLSVSNLYIDSDCYHQEPLIQMEPVLLVPSEHPLVKKAVIKPDYTYPWVDTAWLAGERFIVMNRGQEPRQMLQRMLGPVFDQIKIVMEVRTVRTQIRAVEHRIGIIQTAAGLDEIHKNENSNQLVRLSFGQKHKPITFWLCYHKDQYLGKSLEYFMVLCREEFRKLSQQCK